MANFSRQMHENEEILVGRGARSCVRQWCCDLGSGKMRSTLLSLTLKLQSQRTRRIVDSVLLFLNKLHCVTIGFDARLCQTNMRRLLSKFKWGLKACKGFN